MAPNGNNAARLNLPIFGAIHRTITTANTATSIVCMPTPFYGSSVLRTVSTNVGLVVAVARNVPALSVLAIGIGLSRTNIHVVNPGYPNIVAPNRYGVNVRPNRVRGPNGINVISHSNALACRTIGRAASCNFNRSAYINVNNSPVPNSGFVSVLRVFRGSPRARTVIVVNRVNNDTRRRTTTCVGRRIAGPIINCVTNIATPGNGHVNRTNTVVTNKGKATSRGFTTLRTTNIGAIHDLTSVNRTLGAILGWVSMVEGDPHHFPLRR